jgi:2-oxoglutarate ferredoxin oxidoreductase subunit alpha
VTRTRIGTSQVLALEDRTQVLISLDDSQSLSRIPFLSEEASVFFDNKPPIYVPEEQSLAAHVEPGAELFGMPFSDLASAAAGNSRGRNLTALGGFAAVFGLDRDIFHAVITGKFKAKGEDVLAANIRSFDAGYQHALEQFSDRRHEMQAQAPETRRDQRFMLSGNITIGKAAVDAGVKLYFGYPITPATPIMEYLAKELPQQGGQVIQMEDEISSIAAVCGASYAGTRSMTATSGPGFALMTEIVTHAVMAELPAVIVNAQRGGPATGLPTKTEQSDLHAAVFGGPGDSARIVLAPTNVGECYDCTVKSFQLAEKYQTPVVVLTDFYLDNRVENIPEPTAGERDLKEGNIYPVREEDHPYLRYKLTESGISPRSIPGMEGFTYAATGLEHSQQGLPDYSPDNHMAMSEKRHRKIGLALADLPAPVEFAPDGRLDVGVIGWGSTFGSVLEAVNRAREQGIRAGCLKIVSLFPYHREDIHRFMERCEEILIPELNYEGQLANLIGYLHRKEVKRLNRATGVPIAPSVILDMITSLQTGP